MTTLNLDSSFAGVQFMALWDDAFAPEPDLKTKDAILEIPGSSNVVYQDFGQAAITFDLRAGVTSLTAMQAKRGVRGSLVYYGGTVSARLRSITNVQRDAFGLGWKVTLSFLIG